MNDILNPVLSFLKKIGLSYYLEPIKEDTFLPGLKLRNGALVIDTEKLLYPGDILHEAGHLACMPPGIRQDMNDQLEDCDTHRGGEMMAIAWSYAACIFLKIDLEIVFHQSGYKGGGQNLMENFNAGNVIGLPLLQWYGMSYDVVTAAAKGQKPFPHMVSWICARQRPEQLPHLLTPSEEKGKLQIMHLKRFWEKSLLIREGKMTNHDLKEESRLDKILLYALGLGLEQTTIYLFETAPDFDQFEDWIIKTAGIPASDNVIRYNNEVTGSKTQYKEIPVVLSNEQLECWNKNGYLILKNAVSKEDCDQTIEFICQSIAIKREEPETWYQHHASRQGIMVQVFQCPVIQQNRETAIIRQAYEQLWNRTDLWCTADRVGFNPPETAQWKFPGPDLHWDVSLSLPIPFGLQGILYLADTAANQGALTVVPGFQHKIDNWIGELPEGAHPRQEDLHALGSFPIAADAGDFIIWHQALPHGSSPNQSDKPRFVQYINYEPLNQVESDEWI